MPDFIINWLIKLAVSLGIPWLMKKFPGLPKEVWDVIEAIIKYIQNAPNKPKAVSEMRAKVEECTGVACSPRPVI